MTDARIDAALRDYLEAWRADQANGNTIANLRVEIHQLKISVEEVTSENHLLRLRVERHGQKLRMIEQKLEMSGDDLDTGQHQIEDLKRMLASREREIEKHEEAERWWKRSTVKWIVGGAAWVLATFATTAIALALASPKK